ncbi:TniQ family protein [Polynucleobacter sp. 78F-HAINBA]|uniref:TniQ family protein n=1 Tax=Polynucleobacter sp. 78F-HAINBA TaxID=2689099 RepID=UPI001C0E6F18|nr:TniQ family protein [Polynucleobacter sp. 78F-HAINBA]MBU3590657.1 TniQ family protein [Polynucleobacter sp. 78F-HAINBA]
MSEQLPLLVRTPTPFEDESLFGYLLRISEANGYTSLAEVAPLAKLSVKQFNSKHLPVKKLAGILGFSQESLDRYKYIETSQSLHPRIQLLGHDLSSANNARRLSIKSRVCPLCIGSNGYISAFWDLSLALVCPRHGIIATTKCAKCKNTLSWNRLGVATCRCGADLTGVSQRKAPSSYVDLMQIIHLKLARIPISTLKQKSGFPLSDFEKIPLGQFLDILFAFNSFTLNRKYSASSDSNYAYLNVIDTACNIFSDWPNGLRTFLRSDNNRHIYSDKSFWTRFKGLYRVLNKSLWFDANCNFISDEIIKFGIDEMGELNDTLFEISPIALIAYYSECCHSFQFKAGSHSIGK